MAPDDLARISHHKRHHGVTEHTEKNSYVE
jgi:hypothetical protein